MRKTLSKFQEVERSIFVDFRPQIWTNFIHACKEFSLVEEGDHIAVCISGGKDSMLLAVLMKMLQKISSTMFDITLICMDPGYSENHKNLILQNAKDLKLDLIFFETNIFDVAYNTEESPCYLCARMRRGHLYAKAKELGCNKIALGHHKNDVIETTLMSMLFSGQIQGMVPKLKSTNFDGMSLIRPLFYVDEKDICAWRDKNSLKFLACACKFTENNYSSDKETNSARKKTKTIIENLKKEIADVDNHILKSISNCQADTLLAFKHNGEQYSFLDKFKKGEEDEN